MKRTTVKLPEELDAQLRHEAKRRGMTISELTREAVAAHLGVEDGTCPPRRFLAAGCWDSGEPDLAHRIEEILAEELGRGR